MSLDILFNKLKLLVYLFIAEIRLPLPILIVTAVAAVVIFQVNNNEALVLFLLKPLLVILMQSTLRLINE